MEGGRGSLFFGLNAHGQTGDGIGFGQPAEEAHSASVKRVTAEPLKGALVFHKDDEQRVAIRWGVIDTGAGFDDAWNASQEFFYILQRAVNHFAVCITAQAQDEFMADHLVIPPPLEQRNTSPHIL